MWRAGRRGLHTFTLVAIAISMYTVAMPVVAAGGENPESSPPLTSRFLDFGPCVGVVLNPPDVQIGECSPSTSAIEASATGQNADVNVSWELNLQETDDYDEEDQVKAFHVLRGLHPDQMASVETVDPDTFSYLDEMALVLHPGEIWYQVIVEFEDGSTLAGEPVHVSDVQLQPSSLGSP